jgi:hypothetical protein
MKQFYFDVNSLDFAPQRECKKCPHRHNSLLASEGCEINPFHRWVVYHNFLSKSQYYADYATAKSALRLFCSLEYLFKRKGRELTMQEKLILSVKYHFQFKGDQCFFNGKLFAEIKEVV